MPTGAMQPDCQLPQQLWLNHCTCTCPSRPNNFAPEYQRIFTGATASSHACAGPHNRLTSNAAKYSSHTGILATTSDFRTGSHTCFRQCRQLTDAAWLSWISCSCP